jgi:bacteriochlorophyll 4-vinyl reductase
MQTTDPMPGTQESHPAHTTPKSEPAAQARTIAPVFPLLLLKTLRDVDRPEEVLEDEDLSTSMPRRLGLSDVVLLQIHRLEEEMRRKRLQSASEIEDLIRLVTRRPDAERVCYRAGQRVAQHAWEQRSAAVRHPVRFLPRPLALLAAQRAARRLFRRLVGPGRLTVHRWPVELQIAGSLTARGEGQGAACAFYTGAFEELLQQYTGRSYRAHHSACEARGDSACEWTVQVSA